MSLTPLRVVVLGLGPIGRAVTREILDAPDLRLVGAVDPAPSLVGRDLGALLRHYGADGAKVLGSLDELGRRKADAAVHMAASRFRQALPHLKDLVERKLSTVSTCEELVAAPWRWPKEARALDRAAKKADVRLLSTGVNPGFVMDLLPAALTNVCVSVRSLRVVRHVDTSKRRKALQNKTGFGISRREFRERAREETVGHVGLRDSLLFLVNHLPIDADVTEERLRPIVAKQARGKGRNRVEAGRVLGVHQTVKAEDRRTGKTVATFDLKMAYGLEDPHDEIRIEGDPPIRLRFDGGVPGDRATVGAVLSTLRYLPDAAPGLGAG